MGDRHLPIRPNLNQLRRQAKDLLAAYREGDAAATLWMQEFSPDPPPPSDVRLADAQLALARRYGFASWPRMVRGCEMAGAIASGDAGAVRKLLADHPELRDANVLGADSNWGPPIAHAANLGRTEIVEALGSAGAKDLQWALDRACLQGNVALARRLVDLGAAIEPGLVMGPAETQSGAGMRFLLEHGAEIADESGDPLAPVALVLQTYCRDPEGKHECLELFAAHGVNLPDTPPLAVHRGRIDLLDAHWRRNPEILDRTWDHTDIYPPELGCHDDHSLALHGTPLAGGTLLHLCVDNDEIEVARWLLEHGADVNARAAVDADGFGGHTALFGCVVSQTWRVGRRRDAGFARLLLDAGAALDVRASLRKRLRFVEDETEHEYRDVTARSWGQRFHDPAWVNRAVVDLLEGLGAPT